MALAANSPSVLHDAISPQPLAQALDTLAHQTGLQVIYVSSLVQGQKSGRAPAGMQALEALAHLLEGTGLTYTALTAASVRITALPQVAPGHTESGAVAAACRWRGGTDYGSLPAGADLGSPVVSDGADRRAARARRNQLISVPYHWRFRECRTPTCALAAASWCCVASHPRTPAATARQKTTSPRCTMGCTYRMLCMVDMNMLDLQQIEVLRGPQNALVGRNAFAGAILYEPERPTAQFQSRAEVEGGSDGFARASGYVSGPLFGKLAGRLAAAREIFDGTIRNRADPAHNLGGWRRDAVSGALQWNAEGSLSARLSGLWYEVQRDATPRFPIGGERAAAFQLRAAALTAASMNYCGAFPAPETIDISPDARGQSSRTRLGRFELTWRGRSIQVTSLTGYVDSTSGLKSRRLGFVERRAAGARRQGQQPRRRGATATRKHLLQRNAGQRSRMERGPAGVR